MCLGGDDHQELCNETTQPHRTEQHELVSFVVMSHLCLDCIYDLTMELEGGHRNSVLKRYNLIKIDLVWFILICTLSLNGIQVQIMELKVPSNLCPYYFLTNILVLNGNQDLRTKLKGAQGIWIINEQTSSIIPVQTNKQLK